MNRRKSTETVQFYWLFVVEHVLELADRDEGDDEQMHPIVRHVVVVHPYVVQQRQNIAQHYAKQMARSNDQCSKSQGDLRQHRLTTTFPAVK